MLYLVQHFSRGTLKKLIKINEELLLLILPPRSALFCFVLPISGLDTQSDSPTMGQGEHEKGKSSLFSFFVFFLQRAIGRCKTLYFETSQHSDYGAWRIRKSNFVAVLLVFLWKWCNRGTIRDNPGYFRPQMVPITLEGT